jgi:N-acetylglucosaminyldiphosphoundecaprenol N-acetyl-beta-D-mannosaminyltransferase
MTTALNSVPSVLGSETSLTIGPETEPSRIPFGRLFAHNVTLAEAVSRIIDRSRSGSGGFVVTPNVDHICVAEHDPELRNAYREAFLSLADGMPLLWMARAFGTPLAEKVSGSDLIVPLLQAAAEASQTVYFLGSTPENCVEAIRRLKTSIPALDVVGWASPRFTPSEATSPEIETALDQIAQLRPGLVLFAFGNPKQEYAMLRYRDRYFPAIGLGVGASIDFLAGAVQRSPKWMSDHGLEWLYRLKQEPARLWQRYLVRDRAILRIFWRTRRRVRDERARRN